MKQNEVLAEANKLVSNGLRKAAIDLLREYLDSDPNATKVLSTLGRAYLLDRQPQKAVIYLKRSLEISQRAKSVGTAPPDYRSEAFGNDDMAFVEAEEASAEEQTFDFEDEAQSVKGGVRARPDIESPPINAVEARGADDRAQVPDTVPADIHERLAPDEGTLSGETSNDEPVETDGLLETPDQCDIDEDEAAESTTVDDSRPSNDWNEQPYLPESPTSEPIEAGISGDFNATEELDAFEQVDEGVEEDFEEESPLDLPFADTAIDDDDELEDADSESLPGELHLALPVSIDDESDDLDLEDLEDLDDFDEFASRVVEDKEDDDVVTREQRARQIAAEVLAEADWESTHLSLLQEIFVEKGWSATRKALEVAIQRGLTPDELAIAREIRALWEDGDQYWTTFHKIKSGVAFCQADAAYRHMSWLEAIRIIRCFPDVPEVEEVYDFIEESYEQWYNSARLRLGYKAFFKFLRYRASLMKRSARGRFALSFNEPSPGDTWLDSDALDNALSPAGQEIQSLGLALNSWPRPPENKIKIIQAHLEVGHAEAAARVKAKLKEQPPQEPKPQTKQESQMKQEPSFGFGSSIWQGADHSYHGREE